MKLFHNATISVFSHEKDNENLTAIEQAFSLLVPLNFTNEKIAVKKITATGFSERKIFIFELHLQKERHISAFIDRLKSSLCEIDKQKIQIQLDTRLDEELFFFLRFDKWDLIERKELHLTESGDCFHIKLSVAAFPKKRGVAMGLLRKLFN